eukprot:COSAG01_NODE_6190_length_3803_cov_3.030238_5_plen_335_part_00
MPSPEHKYGYRHPALTEIYPRFGELASVIDVTAQVWRRGRGADGRAQQAVADVGHAGRAGPAAGESEFPRVHWVAVPKVLRARRANILGLRHLRGQPAAHAVHRGRHLQLEGMMRTACSENPSHVRSCVYYYVGHLQLDGLVWTAGQGGDCVRTRRPAIPNCTATRGSKVESSISTSTRRPRVGPLGRACTPATPRKVKQGRGVLCAASAQTMAHPRPPHCRIHSFGEPTLQARQPIVKRAAAAPPRQPLSPSAVGQSCACIGSLCLRHCVHGAPIQATISIGESQPQAMIGKPWLVNGGHGASIIRRIMSAPTPRPPPPCTHRPRRCSAHAWW